MSTKEHSPHGQTHHIDALVIGTGLAGLSYCYAIGKRHPDKRIIAVSKDSLEECNSRYAQGGIAAGDKAPKAQASHINDTLRAGDKLCYQPSVETIIGQSDKAIKQLIDLGVPFEQDEKNYLLAKEGGHSARRIYFCGDQTGKKIMQTLLKKIAELPNVTLLANHTAVNLICQQALHQPNAQAEVLGAYLLDEKNKQINTYLSRVCVLATGGAGKTFQFTTNPEVATGDGVAMAYRAGAAVGNMEFYQFHPTLLYHQKINNFLISEALRGEGAYLRNGDSLERFMHHYAPEQLELATRDVVARAIFSEIERSSAAHVYLDVRHLDKDYLKQRFPQIWQTLTDIGIDMSKALIPVVPAAHYQCGGVITDCAGKSSLKRLYAIGEVACTGLHGANRLASNSLLEAVVMAELAADVSSNELDTALTLLSPIDNWQSGTKQNSRRASQINAHWRGLRGEMTSYAGIVRTEAGLNDLLALILTRKKSIDDYYWQHEVTRDLIELRNIVLNAELIVRAALARQESRGGHYREDYPSTLDVAVESHCNQSFVSQKRLSDV